jgi:hypothetical protein
VTSLRSSFLALVIASPIVALSVQACGSSDDPPATNPGVDSGKDTATADTGPKLPTESLKVLSSTKEDIDADLSCLGKGSPDGGVDIDGGVDGGPAPMVGDLVDTTFKVVEFGGGSSDIVVGGSLDLFYKNTLSMGEPEAKGTTDDKGLVTLKIPFGKPFTYRVNPNTNLRTFVYFDSDAVTKLSGTYEATAITKSKYDQFALAITGKTGFLIADGTGIYSARVDDCQGRHISNAIVELVDATTGTALPTGPGDTDLKPIHYLTDNDLPSTGRYWTSRSGLVASINVPDTKSGKKIKAVAKGMYGGSTEIRKFAEVDLEITASAVNFRTLAVK